MKTETLVKCYKSKVKDCDNVFMSAYFKLNHSINPEGFQFKNWRFESNVNYASWCVFTTGRTYCAMAIQTIYSKN